MKKPTEMEIEQAVRAREALMGWKPERDVNWAWKFTSAANQQRFLSAIRVANRVRDRWEKNK